MVNQILTHPLENVGFAGFRAAQPLTVQPRRPSQIDGAPPAITPLLTACPVLFQFCQAKQKAALLELLHELYNFLAIQAGECLSQGPRVVGSHPQQLSGGWLAGG